MQHKAKSIYPVAMEGPVIEATPEHLIVHHLQLNCKYLHPMDMEG
eukprot:CAMPEP_0185023362 /NCGR_PEP_ID=MMETSP1103-20130426/6047_1 /TAXON_ID=36769 /ORGANISM="Paraphysomonas bandaiensis, Strain Caron Lab Isolate" /LENGTH=44 /DNA_ID= /DNA_START= /DNA_END= /DNA_ORIENTATION=